MKTAISFAGPLLIVALAGVASALPTGAPPAHSGAPGDTTCTACHGGQPNTGTGKVTITFANGTTYTPGQTKRVTVAVSDPNALRWGFQASPRLDSNPQTSGAGTLAPVDANTQLTASNGTLQWITHTLDGTRLGTTGGVSFQFDWTAPATDSGPVTFYVAANAANGNNAPTGDLIYTTSAQLTVGASSSKPAILQSGVVNGASLKAGLVAGSWFTVFGSNLSSTTRIWNTSDIVNNTLPASLDGVSVTVNGKPAAVYYISPNQINALAPDDDSSGTVNVVVTTAAGASDPVTATMVANAPALFLFDPQSRKYAAAVMADGTLLGPAGLFGAAAVSKPAKPGDVIALFGTGCGKTNPAVPSNIAFSGAAPLVNPPTATIGGVNATVQFAGLSSSGLYQFNIVVPASLADGDQPVVLSQAGISTQDGVFVTVQR